MYIEIVFLIIDNKFIRKNQLNNNITSESLWTPMRLNDVHQETIKVVNSIIDKIPDLPLSVSKIIEMISDEDSTLEELVEVVSSDPMLVSNILKVVNSSYYGLRHKTDNIHLAIVLLGFQEVRKIVLRSGLARALGKGKTFKGYDTRKLWLHSYLVSICAETFVSEDDKQGRGVLLTLGLLHDIGKFTLYDIGMLLIKRGIKPKGVGDMSELDYLLEKEEQLFRINHNIVGRLLAKKWNLSERFISVLECHHYPSFFGISEIPTEYEKEISAISISDLIVNKFLNEKNVLPEPHPHFFNLLGFNPPLESIITKDLVRKLKNAKEFLRLLK